MLGCKRNPTYVTVTGEKDTIFINEAGVYAMTKKLTRILTEEYALKEVGKPTTPQPNCVVYGAVGARVNLISISL
jgi:hypothetical protein